MPRVKIEDVMNVVAEATKSKRPFVVRFRKKTDDTIRVMTCLSGPPEDLRFVKGVLPKGQREEEDQANKVVTVFAVDVFHELLAKGARRVQAGQQSWRRIPINRVLRAELL